MAALYLQILAQYTRKNRLIKYAKEILMSVVIDLSGPIISEEERCLLTHINTAGVLLFTRNIQDRAQLVLLTQQIHAINPHLILFIDHEGGYVQRIQRLNFRPLPAATLFGDIYDISPQTALQTAETYGAHLASDLRAVGIHSSLAPVLDIHGPNPIIGGLYRAFHQDPDIVTEIAAAFIRGMHRIGMPSVGKHFPGHGFCVADSHVDFPVDKRRLEQLQHGDLKPYQALIQINLLDAIMPAHIKYPAIDDRYAAGYSHIWLKHILREELGFTGLIISDCLGMKGADIGDLLTRGKQALDAGCNLVIAANQTRQCLHDFLNSLSTGYLERNQIYLERFRKSIKPLPTTNSVEKRISAEIKLDPNNPTQTI